ncbi:MAG: thermonuclease family protein [Candidatus Peregrinibacteria bacterium]|nr:thermonuclease family protein [Candidatus Peregrinibacteria bacterium]
MNHAVLLLRYISLLLIKLDNFLIKIKKVSFLLLIVILLNGCAKTETPSTKVSTIDAKTAQSTIEQQSKSELHKVISVTDGDTIKVDINGKTETLRLIGIDTPETLDPRKPVQCFGKEASKKAKEILTDKSVRLEADNTQGERDKYNRLLRYVFLEDGTFYNKYMIEEGYAHEYTYQSNPYKYQTDFKAAEKNAREKLKGLWSSDTCNGDTTKPADPQAALVEKGNIDEPQIKKSTSGICHEKGVSAYYINTKNYTPYSTIKDCLNSGGRLSKKY